MAASGRAAHPDEAATIAVLVATASLSGVLLIVVA